MAAKGAFTQAVAEIEERGNYERRDWTGWEKQSLWISALVGQGEMSSNFDAKPVRDEFVWIRGPRVAPTIIACVSQHENHWGAIVVAVYLGNQFLHWIPESDKPEAAEHLKRYIAEQKSKHKPFLTVAPTLMLARLYSSMLGQSERTSAIAVEELPKLGLLALPELCEAMRIPFYKSTPSLYPGPRRGIAAVLQRILANGRSTAVDYLLLTAQAPMTTDDEFNRIVSVLAETFGEEEIEPTIDLLLSKWSPQLDKTVFFVFAGMSRRPGGEEMLLGRLEQRIRVSDDHGKNTLSAMMARMQLPCNRVIPILERVAREQRDPTRRGYIEVDVKLARMACQGDAPHSK
jgi:hypothetical protein